MAAKSKLNTTKDWSQLSFLSIYKNLPSIPLVDVSYAGKGDVGLVSISNFDETLTLDG
ncbi:MAG: hypothetical protein IPL21_06345 [Saprospirales bacterium]|nr:hypothetical protein [Saprospirales bacterium]